MNLKQGALDKNLLTDVRAGLVVFLIAIPLSLGISMASGAPSSAGLVSAILGGLLGAYLGGSYVTINGPAAGLIVVVLSAIQTLGNGDPAQGFRRMLACVVVVGALQILSGLLKAGRFVAIFPLSVIHGMLSAIGLIIMIKQLHVFLGVSVTGNLVTALTQIPHSLQVLHPESALIGLASLAVVLGYPQLKNRLTSVLPAPLIVVLLAVLLGAYLTPDAWVTVPLRLQEFFIFPNFDQITGLDSVVSIVSIFFVASLESILSASAVDKLDPLRRESNFDRELWSKGVVNLVCGAIGGLPIIAEIVRSSANITQGGKTPLANFTHGALILLFVVGFPAALNHIPLSALAAILLVVGYRLANPGQFVEMWHLGVGTFLSFVVTIVVTLLEDLLVGILAGMLTEAAVCFFLGAKISKLLAPSFTLEATDDEVTVAFAEELTFLSVMEIKKIVHQVSRYQHIRIDLSAVNYIDATSFSAIFRETGRIQQAGHLADIVVPVRHQRLYQKLRNH